MVDETLDRLEAQLFDNRKETTGKLTARVRHLEGQRPWFIALGLVGTIIAGTARFINPASPDFILLTGLLLTFVGGLAVAAGEYRKLELSTDIANVENIAAQAILRSRSGMEELEARATGLELINDRQTRQIAAIAALHDAASRVDETCMQVDLAAQQLIDSAALEIGSAIGFEGGEYFTFSVFMIDHIQQEAVRIAARWADPNGEKADARNTWLSGEGYTGLAWRNGTEVIETDCSLPDVKRRYAIPPAAMRENDDLRYRSVAAIPIRVGADRSVWGIAIATSDKVGRFAFQGDVAALCAAAMVRNVAEIMALLAARPMGRIVPNQEQAAELS